MRTLPSQVSWPHHGRTRTQRNGPMSYAPVRVPTGPASRGGPARSVDPERYRERLICRRQHARPTPSWETIYLDPRGDERDDVVAERFELAEVVGKRPDEDALRSARGVGADAFGTLLGRSDQQRESPEIFDGAV